MTVQSCPQPDLYWALPRVISSVSSFMVASKEGSGSLVYICIKTLPLSPTKLSALQEMKW